MATIEQFRESNETAASDPAQKKHLQRLACKIIKAGGQIPSTEEVIRFVRPLINNKDVIKVECIHEEVLLGVLNNGMHLMYQIAYINERM